MRFDAAPTNNVTAGRWQLDLNGPSYTTIRGTMKCGAGDTFTIAYPFSGILPNFPAPTAKSFDQERMKELLAQCAESLVRRRDREAAIASNAGYDAEDREACAEQLEEEEEK